jgi:hypothetical protein
MAESIIAANRGAEADHGRAAARGLRGPRGENKGPEQQRLFKRIVWRIQELAEGELPERA